MKRGVTVLTLVGLLTLGTGLAAGPAGASPKAAGHATAKGISGDTVKIRFFTFRPNLFYADAGQTIRVINQDWGKKHLHHTFTSTDGLFDTGILKQDPGFVTVPSTPGTYHFFCQVHPFMSGKFIIHG